MEDEIIITNIQRFSLHDGPGIRTTVFLKGCSLACPWCSNPENITAGIEPYIKAGKKGLYGEYITCDALYNEVVKDSVYYSILNNGASGYNGNQEIDFGSGGITFSGGEPLLQVEKLVPVLKKLRAKRIHTAIETSLYAPKQALRLAIENIDLFIVDIKILDASRCKEVLKGNLDSYYDNLDEVIKSGKPIVVRIPVICGYTDDKENIEKVIALLYKYANKKNVIAIELINGHNLGMSKYISLMAADKNVHIPENCAVDMEFLVRYRELIRAEGLCDCSIEICSI